LELTDLVLGRGYIDDDVRDILVGSFLRVAR
jgi:hypothetical protein